MVFADGYTPVTQQWIKFHIPNNRNIDSSLLFIQQDFDLNQLFLTYETYLNLLIV
jgi:hypothetical protein